jgi:hypothetical protein
MYMFKFVSAAALAVALVAGAGAASANPILTDLPSNTYITIGNLEWTAAAPVSSPNWYGSNTLSGPDLHAGWRFATEEEFANRPDWSAFAGAQSAIYWNTNFNYVDVGDQVNRTLDLSGNPDSLDIWYVRDVNGSGAVPEPATWALMIGGFGMAGAALRRRRTMAAA